LFFASFTFSLSPPQRFTWSFKWARKEWWEERIRIFPFYSLSYRRRGELSGNIRRDEVEVNIPR
jgi:hypothetical protein